MLPLIFLLPLIVDGHMYMWGEIIHCSLETCFSIKRCSVDPSLPPLEAELDKSFCVLDEHIKTLERLDAIRTFGKAESPPALPMVIDKLQDVLIADPDYDLRLEAVSVLGTFKMVAQRGTVYQVKVAKVLARAAAEDSDCRIRRAAIANLAKFVDVLGKVFDASLAKTLLSDNDHGVRMLAVQAIGNVTFVQAGARKSPWTLLTATSILSQALDNETHEGHEDVCIAILDMLNVTLLQAQANSNLAINRNVLMAVERTLSKPNVIIVVLRAMARDTDGKVSDCAANKLIEFIGERAYRTRSEHNCWPLEACRVETLIHLLRNSSDSHVRREVVDSFIDLGALELPQVRHVLTETLLKDSDSYVRRLAAQALERQSASMAAPILLLPPPQGDDTAATLPPPQSDDDTAATGRGSTVALMQAMLADNDAVVQSLVAQAFATQAKAIAPHAAKMLAQSLNTDRDEFHLVVPEKASQKATYLPSNGIANNDSNTCALAVGVDQLHKIGIMENSHIHGTGARASNNASDLSWRSKAQSLLEVVFSDGSDTGKGAAAIEDFASLLKEKGSPRLLQMLARKLHLQDTAHELPCPKKHFIQGSEDELDPEMFCKVFFLAGFASSAAYHDDPLDWLNNQTHSYAKMLSVVSGAMSSPSDGGYIALDTMGAAPTDSMVIISFRGTADVLDVLTDIDLKLVDRWDGSMHSGFKSRCERVPLQKIRKWVERYAHIVLTGHSLGGAIAQCVVLRLLTEEPLMPAEMWRKILCVAFGPPLLVDAKIVDMIEQRRYAHRFHTLVHVSDIVPRILMMQKAVVKQIHQVLKEIGIIRMVEGALASAPGYLQFIAKIGKHFFPDLLEDALQPLAPFGNYYILEGDSVHHVKGKTHVYRYLRGISEKLSFRSFEAHQLSSYLAFLESLRSNIKD